MPVGNKKQPDVEVLFIFRDASQVDPIALGSVEGVLNLEFRIKAGLEYDTKILFSEKNSVEGISCQHSESHDESQ